MTKHKFGGLWTRKKLAVLADYLRFYQNALKDKNLELHYVDAFAGTGSHDPEEEDAGHLIPLEDLKGSVLTALDIEPGFGQYHFNDLNPEHVKALKEIRKNYPKKKIHISQEDANIFIPRFCQSLNRYDRAVLLVDPYSTEFDWESLKHISLTQKIDLWLLFPISVILRMTPRDGDRIRPEWRNTLNRLLGTNEWESFLYKPKKVLPMDDLFGFEEDSDASTERINIGELQQWIANRLKELFPYVAKPLPLKTKGDAGSTLFMFFFAVSNPKPSAWGLAEKVAKDILEKYE